jgi:hypothetical protein
MISINGWKRLGESDVWYRTEKIPTTARFFYALSSQISPMNGRPIALQQEATY